MLWSAAHIQPDVPADGDPIALVIVLAFLAAFSLWVIVSKHKKKKAANAEPVLEDPVAPQPAPGSAGTVKLFDVPDKTAAMLMAIVADKTGKPLNELRFISIKEVTEE